jgi:hypothetical protein
VTGSSRSRRYPAVALRTPLQKLNSIPTSTGPVKVDKNNKKAAMPSIGVSRSPLRSEGDVCASVPRSSARLPAGDG